MPKSAVAERARRVLRLRAFLDLLAERNRLPVRDYKGEPEEGLEGETLICNTYDVRNLSFGRLEALLRALIVDDGAKGIRP